MKIKPEQYNPLFSRLKDNDNEEEISFNKWYDEKFKLMPMAKRLGISGSFAEKEVKNICDRFNLSDWQGVGYVATVTRSVFCGDLNETEVEKDFIQKSGLRKEDKREFFDLIKKASEKISQAGKEEYENTFDIITLKEAIKKYPEIEEQVISNNNLEVEKGGYLAMGTVRNWLKDYFNKAGGSRHNVMERSDYIFNSKVISSLDEDIKKDLEIILKAFDNESLVAINKKDKVIDFTESRNFDKESVKSKGEINSYDNNLKEKGSFIKKSEEKKPLFGKIKSTPHFEVDKRVNEKIPEKTKRDPQRRKQESSDSNLSEKENQKRVEKSNRNVLDLSNYL